MVPFFLVCLFIANAASLRLSQHGKNQKEQSAWFSANDRPNKNNHAATTHDLLMHAKRTNLVPHMYPILIARHSSTFSNIRGKNVTATKSTSRRRRTGVKNLQVAGNSSNKTITKNKLQVAGNSSNKTVRSITKKKLEWLGKVKEWKKCKELKEKNPQRKCYRPTPTIKKMPIRKSLPLIDTKEFYGYKIDHFVQDFGRKYQKNTEEWSKRAKAFKINLEKVIVMRERHTITKWSPGITMFMDYTETEYQKLLGYRGRRKPRESDDTAPQDNETVQKEPPKKYSVIDPSKKLTSFVRDQGGCGSCWAAAAISTIEGVVEANPTVHHALVARAEFLETPLETLSTQAMVSCGENKRHCQMGGCRGGTTQMAFEMVKRRGLPMASEWLYHSGQTGHDEQCNATFFNTELLLTISGYVNLPTTSAALLIGKLYERGHPIAVAVDAGNWQFYAGGIYTDTTLGPGEFTVNHVVTLMGYTLPNEAGQTTFGDIGANDDKLLLLERKKSSGYYLLKNSWGPMFGESGFIRIEMKEKEDKHCGYSNNTHTGKLCGGEQVWVCGTCGILYDMSYPLGVKVIKKGGHH